MTRAMVADLMMHSFDYPPLDGGIARVCAEIVEHVRCQGGSVRVLTQQITDGPHGPAVPGPDEVRLRPGRPWREFGAIARLIAHRGEGPVVCGRWWPEGFLARLSGARPLVILAHGAELLPAPKWRRKTWSRLRRDVLQAADLVVANSSFTAGLVRDVAPEARAVAVPLAVDHRRFQPGSRELGRRHLKLPKDALVISTVGRLAPHKAHDVVIDALARLPNDVRERFVYVVGGQGSHRSILEAHARQRGVDAQVRWLGYVSETDLPRIYHASDLFVLVSRDQQAARRIEGFGLVFLEAQACGVPVLGARTGGIPDAVDDGDGGWLVPGDDSAAVAAHLQRLAEDPAGFAAAGKDARARVERDFTWDHYLTRLSRSCAEHGIDLG